MGLTYIVLDKDIEKFETKLTNKDFVDSFLNPQNRQFSLMELTAISQYSPLGATLAADALIKLASPLTTSSPTQKELETVLSVLARSPANKLKDILMADGFAKFLLNHKKSNKFIDCLTKIGDEEKFEILAMPHIVMLLINPNARGDYIRQVLSETAEDDKARILKAEGASKAYEGYQAYLEQRAQTTSQPHFNI